MFDMEKMGLLNENEIDSYSRFNVDLAESTDATSPWWSNALKVLLAAGSVASAFI